MLNKNTVKKTSRMKIVKPFITIFVAAFLFIASTAAQACLNPTGVEGEIIYNGSHNIPSYCDGSDWIAMAGGRESEAAPYNGYLPNPIVFSDGNYIRGNPDAAASDSRMTFSVWLKRTQVGNIFNYLIDAHGNYAMDMVFFTGNVVTFSIKNSSGTIAAFEGSKLINNSGWHHLLISIDMDNPANRHVYINDVVDSGTWNTYTTGEDIDWGGLITIGARQNTTTFLGELADFWLQPGVYMDLSVEENRRNFIDANKNPVFLGSNGQVPTGSSPYIFLSGDTDDWNTNKGAGADFGVTGTLTSGEIPPFKCTDGVAPANGAVCGGDADKRVVFVTSTTTTGNTGGIAGADAICQARAEAGGLIGRYAAWLSDGNAANSPSQRFEQSSVPYTRLDGRIVANNWADLTDGTLENSLNMTEFGNLMNGGAYNNTNADGTIRHTTNTCSNFMSTAGSTFGDNINDTTWISNSSFNCTQNRYLYCFEQPAIQTTEIVPDGLVGHWRLDETSGIALKDDIAGNSAVWSAVSTGSPTIVSTLGRINNAINFESTLNYLRLPDNSNQLTFPFTVSIWANPTTSSVWRTLIQGDDWNDEISAYCGYTIKINTANRLSAEVGSCGGVGSSFRRSFLTTQTIPANQWGHFAAVFNNINDIDIYYNGENLNTSSSGAAATIGYRATSKPKIGAVTAHQFSGYMDDIRLYNRALTSEEITQIYKANTGIRYNSNERILEYFNGNKFISMTKKWPEIGGTLSANSCQNIGEICDDGTIYAGLTPDGNAPMFTTTTNAPGGPIYAWNNGNATGRVSVMPSPCYSSGEAGCITGQLNTSTAAGLDSDSGAGGDQPHQAIVFCDTLNSNTHDDWYLPAQQELDILFDNRTVGALNGTFENEYWTSSEINDGAVVFFDFTGGGSNNSGKENTLSVRCVRKGSLTVGDTGGLVAHYKLDETTGSTAVDASGNGHDGTMQNTMSAASDTRSGAVKRALNFNGFDAWIDVPGTPDLRITGDLTTSLWLYRNVTGQVTSLYDMAGDGESSTVNHLYQLRILANNRLSFEWEYANGSNASVTSTASLSSGAGEWVNLLVTRNSTSKEIKFYENGVQLGTTLSYVNDATGGSATNLYIGEDSSTSLTNYIYGMLDDFRIYNRTLSQKEITTIYKLGTPTGQTVALPQGCPNIGDTCDDGTVYAGLSPDGNVPMYTLQTNSPTNLGWAAASGTSYTTTNASSSTQGAANAAIIMRTDSNSTSSGFQEHPATKYCADMNALGALDFYLPAIDEIRVLYDNRTLIPNLGSSQYWTSTETGSNIAYTFNFADGTTNYYGTKNGGFRVRCVRKGPAPRCTNPYGIEGEIVYNQDHDVVQFCDGARWIGVGRADMTPTPLAPPTTAPTDMAAHWQFEETSGAVAEDSTANNLDLTFAGSMTAAGATGTGVDGNAFTFNGSTNYLAELTNSPLLQIDQNTSFTASTWVNLSNNGQFRNILRYDDLDGADGDNTNPRAYLIWGVRADGSIYFRYGDSGGTNSLHETAAGTVPNGAWHHITVVRDVTNDRSKIYLNGTKVLDEADASTGTWATTGQYMLVGRYLNTGAGEYFSGQMDDLRYYGRALDDTEIGLIYSTTAP